MRDATSDTVRCAKQGGRCPRRRQGRDPASRPSRRRPEGRHGQLGSWLRFPLLKKLAASWKSSGPTRKRLQTVRISNCGRAKTPGPRPGETSPALRCPSGSGPGLRPARSQPDRSGRTTRRDGRRRGLPPPARNPALSGQAAAALARRGPENPSRTDPGLGAGTAHRDGAEQILGEPPFVGETEPDCLDIGRWHRRSRGATSPPNFRTMQARHLACAPEFTDSRCPLCRGERQQDPLTSAGRSLLRPWPCPLSATGRSCSASLTPTTRTAVIPARGEPGRDRS